MNPPFGRASLDAEQRERWSRSLYGHANWYGVFLQAAVERTAPGGLVGAVLPASFLGGAYYRRLRRLLSEEAPLERLRLIDERAGVFATEPAVLVQRTTAPEQPRRLVAAVLTQEILERWGGSVIVENHVNVLRSDRRGGALAQDLLAALLNTETLDRLYRCITGSVAVSAYELEALPLPSEALVRAWRDVSEGELETAIAAAYR